MLRKRSWEAGEWSTASSDRPRVLVESSDAVEQWALTGALEDAGYEVAVCDGPSFHGAPCPLVRSGECHLAAGADVIVNRFRLSEPANQDVVWAVQAARPETPVIVEAALQERERHAELLSACRVFPSPQSIAEVLAAVSGALGNGETA
jgi:hypothetical protein